jgi:hypothetical protein
MTTVRIALIEPWPGQRMGGRGFRISSFLVVLADDSRGRALPVWLNGPEGHGLFRDHGHHPHPEPAEVITADLAAQFTRDVPVPRHRRHWPRLLRRHPPVRMATR